MYILSSDPCLLAHPSPPQGILSEAAHATRTSKPSQVLAPALERASALANQCLDGLDTARAGLAGLQEALAGAAGWASVGGAEAVLGPEWAAVWRRMADLAAEWAAVGGGAAAWAQMEAAVGAAADRLREWVGRAQRRHGMEGEGDREGEEETASGPSSRGSTEAATVAVGAGRGGGGVGGLGGTEPRVRALTRPGADVDPEEERAAFVQDVQASWTGLSGVAVCFVGWLAAVRWVEWWLRGLAGARASELAATCASACVGIGDIGGHSYPLAGPAAQQVARPGGAQWPRPDGPRVGIAAGAAGHVPRGPEPDVRGVDAVAVTHAARMLS